MRHGLVRQARATFRVAPERWLVAVAPGLPRDLEDRHERRVLMDVIDVKLL